MNHDKMIKRLKAGEDPLDLSIEKWQDIVDGKGRNEVSYNCALCHMYTDCRGCPVNAKTNAGCRDTPYYLYVFSHSRRDALKEIQFLKSLKKPNEAKNE